MREGLTIQGQTASASALSLPQPAATSHLHNLWRSDDANWVILAHFGSLAANSPTRPMVGLQLARLIAGSTAVICAQQQYQRNSLE